MRKINADKISKNSSFCFQCGLSNLDSGAEKILFYDHKIYIFCSNCEVIHLLRIIDAKNELLNEFYKKENLANTKLLQTAKEADNALIEKNEELQKLKIEYSYLKRKKKQFEEVLKNGRKKNG